MPQLKNIAAVILDVGQTILSPDYSFIQTLFSDYGVHTTIPELARGAALGREKYFRGDDDNRWKEYFEFWFSHAGVAPQYFPTLLLQVRERHHREYLWNWVEPTARTTFEQLRARGYRLAVVSNADGKVESVLHGLELAHFFECIIDSKIVGVEKPDPRIFQLALEHLQLPGSSCVYVGDNYDRDVIGARRANLTPILLDPFNVVPEDDVRRITQLVDLLPLLGETAVPPTNQKSRHETI